MVKKFFLPALVILSIGLAFAVGWLGHMVSTQQKDKTTAVPQASAASGIGNDKSQSGRLAEFLKSAIDPKTLKSCLDSGKYDARLTSDEALASSLGVTGTPGFFVNNMFYGGAFSWDGNLPDPSDPQGKKEIQNSSMKVMVAGATTKSNSKVSLATIKDLFGKDLIKFGDGNTKVLFVEVSDPSCPYCQIAGGKNATLLASFDTSGTYDAPVGEMRKMVDAGQASFVQIYSPGHGHGEMGMKALYCANEQGKFWEVNDLLMSNDGYVLMNGS